MSLSRMLGVVARRYGQKTAIISDQRRLSYADLNEASNRLASALLKLGVGKGDRVAMLLANSPEFVISFFGIVKTGAIAVLLDPKYKLDELTSLFDDSQPKVLFTESPTLEPLIPAWPRFKCIQQVIDLSGQLKGQFLSYDELLASGTPLEIKTEPEPDDLAVIAYTSGPSFGPHGIMLTHQNIVTEAEISGEGFALTDKDVVPLFGLPLHHAAGLTIVALTTIFRGGTIVMIPGLSLPALLGTLEKEKATLLIGVPFIFALLVRHAEEEGLKYDLSSLRLCASGGSPLPVEVSQRFKQLYGRHIAQFWGLTETTAHITCQAVDGSGVLGSIGKPLRGCVVKVVDDEGRELLPNQTGELICRGPLMKGYYQNPKATAEMIKGGWLYTGDIGQIDNEGNIFITGRKKDLIIIKGQNIAPGDIEWVLSRHPKVAEVAALGIPDESRGEVVGVAIRLKAGATATESGIKRFCLERLANYKAPKQVFFVDSMPKMPTGKIDKEALRELLSIPPIFPKVAVS
ncbi:MAG: AMP-binding protein [Dehalococcoidales bacterium]|nr:AMP-binding protein [Dehalococcoidales bacterium]